MIKITIINQRTNQLTRINYQYSWRSVQCQTTGNGNGKTSSFPEEYLEEMNILLNNVDNVLEQQGRTERNYVVVFILIDNSNFHHIIVVSMTNPYHVLLHKSIICNIVVPPIKQSNSATYHNTSYKIINIYNHKRKKIRIEIIKFKIEPKNQI